MPTTLVCFPCAGASAGASYGAWTKAGGGDFLVKPVELPGRGVRMGEAPIEDFKALIEDLTVRAARDIDGDYVLLGHSFGALLAYECAYGLPRLVGREPRALVAACCGAPSRFDVERFARSWSAAEVQAEIIRLNAAAAAVLDEPVLRDLVVRQTQTDFRAIGNMRVAAERIKLTCPILVLGGEADEVRREHLEDWREHTNGPCEVRLMPGGHFAVQDDPKDVMASISRSLATIGPSDERGVAASRRVMVGGR